MNKIMISAGILGVFLVVLVLILLGRVTTGEVTDQEKQALVSLGFYQFNQPRVLSSIPLKDLDNNDVTLPGLHNEWQLVNFGYMFCPDICPVNLALMAEVKEAWDENSDNQALALTHITFDPERDTPENLSQYLEYIDPAHTGLTGELENIRQVAQQLNVVFIHEKPDQYGNYFITHSDTLALLNPAGQFVGLFKGPYDKDNVLNALNLLIN